MIVFQQKKRKMPAGELGSKLRLNWGVFDYSPWGYAEAALRIGGIVIGVCAPAGFVNREKLGDQYASGVFLLLLGLGLIAHFYDRIKLKCVLSLTILFFNVIAHLILGICLLVPDTVSAVFVVLFSGLGTIAQLVRIVDFKIGGYLIDIEVGMYSISTRWYVEVTHMYF